MDSGKDTKGEWSMFKILLFAIMIFLSTFTGCGDDGGGGGGGGGENNGRPDGDPKITPSIRKAEVGSFGQIGAGGAHTCALTSGGGVNCWGSGVNGRLGNDANTTLKLPGNPVVDNGGNPLTGVVQVSAGSEHSCALDSEGGVWCWGNGANGRLGNDASSESDHAVAVVNGDSSVTALTGIVQIGGSSTSPCALTVEGGVVCWGYNSDGQIGNNFNTDRDHPVDVVASGTNPTALSGIVQISQSSASNHTCALTVEGGVVCWGKGGDGQLGNGYNTDKNYPVDVVASGTVTTPLGGIVQITTGGTHTCAITKEGGVKCWGKGSNGRLGNKSSTDTNYPVDVVDEDSAPLTGVVQIGSGTAHTCALLEGGGVVCWGYNSDGQMGNGGATDKDHAVKVLEKEGSSFALSGILQMSVGYNHACALNSDGEILCWGDGADGRLGNNATDNQPAPVKVVADANDPPVIFNVGVWRGQYRCYEDDGTCEINPDSLLRPVLTGSREGASATPAVKVLGVEEDEVITLHLDANCSGESIGTGTVGTEADEITITPTTSLAAKENRIYAKVGSLCSASGADYTYTGGEDRIAGDGEDISTNRTPTLTVNLLSNGDKVSIHKSPDCSDTVLASDTATGNSLDVTLSDLGNTGSHTLYLKQGDVCHPRGLGYKLANYIGESSRVDGGDEYVCAVSNTGGVKCWGRGYLGRLGNNASSNTDAPDDVDVVGGDNDNNTALSGIVQVSTGGTHSCALTFEGHVVCWGYGLSGRLGNDGTAQKEHPVYVVASNGRSNLLNSIVQIDAGSLHTCALTSAGGVKCWGTGNTGQLGYNGNANKDAPVNVVTSNTDSKRLSSIVQISAGGTHTCALTSGGNVKCWGENDYGQLGNDCLSSCTDERAPVDVVASGTDSTPLSGIIQVSAGNDHTCALTSTGSVVCWGRGSNGQLGNGDVDNKDAPVDVTITGTTALTGIASIASGDFHSCALKSAGGVVCWGGGGNGRLGDGNNTQQTRPVDVLTSAQDNPALASITQIGPGNAHSCAVTTAGGVTCWGAGGWGQLGNDGTSSSNLPVNVVDTDDGSGVLNIGTKNRYVCTDLRCGFVD